MHMWSHGGRADASNTSEAETRRGRAHRHRRFEVITMRSTSPRGRVYRRCGCRDTQHKPLGARCPQLAADRHHGTWTYAVDSHSSPDHRRHTVHRGGFPK